MHTHRCNTITGIRVLRVSFREAQNDMCAILFVENWIQSRKIKGTAQFRPFKLNESTLFTPNIVFHLFCEVEHMARVIAAAVKIELYKVIVINLHLQHGHFHTR